jgi:citrate lyase subunit beta/citryl-CoA lyase
MNNTGTAGNKGINIKSDCFVQFDKTENGGLKIVLKSKVEAYYGNSIRNLALKILNYFNIDNAILTIEDTGALEFVLAARIEAAVKKVISSDKEFLFPLIEENKETSDKTRFRFSRLYLPGNTPKLMINAGIHKPHGLILDLEDAVAPNKKFEARFLVRNALRSLHFYGAERMIRINQGEPGLEDLKFIIPHHPNLILVPKCESTEDIKKVNDVINHLKNKHNVNMPIWLMPIVESAKGVMEAYNIARSADNIAAMAIGLEDYTADLGVRRTKEGIESFFARSMVVNACKAAGIQPIDSVFSDVADMEGLSENVKTSKTLGFEGMGCIHPRQIKVINENFAPDEVEIEKAKKIFLAFKDAQANGLGVVSLGSKMIDAPVVKRAITTIELAVNTGKLDKNWDNVY